MAEGSMASSSPCLIIWCWRCHQEMCMVHHACTLCSLSRRCPPCYTVLWVGSPMAVLPHTLPAGRLCRLPKSSRAACAGRILAAGRCAALP